jgi:hypothetical protein
MDVRKRQRVVIEFLTIDGSSLMETDGHLSSVYGEVTMLAQTLVHHHKSGEKDVTGLAATDPSHGSDNGDRRRG